jgi:hypothetical protein
MLCVYHGTDLKTGLAFLNNQLPLDAAQAAAAKIDGPPGFFPATDLASAEFFAIRRGPGVVVEFQLSPDAVRDLTSAGMIRQPLPVGPRSPPGLSGDEWIVPPDAFGLFNQSRASGKIVGAPAPAAP